MDSFIEILSSYGYIGFFIAAFIAGSVFPFSSEAIMVALIAAGLNPVQLVVYGTVGNTLGSMFNYGVGRLGKPEWISKYLHVKDEQLAKTQKFLAGRGAWMGVITFLPILGSAISVALGLMRANVVIATTAIFIGKLARYVILMLGTTALIGCTPSTSRHKEKPTITVSIEPLRYFTEGIAGDRFAVNTMLPAGASPETYEPTARQMMALDGSCVYIKVGRLGFETSWTGRFRNASPDMLIVDASEGIDETGDPHTWTSPRNARIILQNITQALIALDAKDSLYFMHRHDSIDRRIVQLDKEIASLLKQSPDKAFMIYHPALTAFAKEYGLRQIVVENDGKEPSATEMKRIIEQAREYGAKCMLLQKEFAEHSVAALAEATGVEVKEINPLAYDWEAEMKNIAKAICNR